MCREPKEEEKKEEEREQPIVAKEPAKKEEKSCFAVLFSFRRKDRPSFVWSG